MSFSGRLNGGSGNGGNSGHGASAAHLQTGSSNVIPLSISSHNFDGGSSEAEKLSLPFLMTMPRPHIISEEQKQVLVQDLIECKGRLLDQSKAMKQLKEAHEAQLVAVSRQLLELECGLRKRERELCAILQQRDRVIREQSHIIRFLTKKTGTKRRDIVSLADEAVAKIPQWSDKTKTSTPKMVKSKSEVTLTSILESESENDSAVILDDLASPASKSISSSGTVSRSVSDVMSSEEQAAASPSKEDLKQNSPFASPNYRGFLLRHGSYERYKIRSKMQQMNQQHHHHAEYSTQVTANATLPRNRKLRKEKSPISTTAAATTSSDLKTVIVISNDVENSSLHEANKINNSHRSVTKPRDVKNKNRTKMFLRMSGSPPNSKSPSPPIIVSDKFIQQSGSVYCSLYGETSEDEQPPVVSYA
jgi:hypothetical protein